MGLKSTAPGRRGAFQRPRQHRGGDDRRDRGGWTIQTVQFGYLAAIVAAANAGGAGSVLGDTTTTMLWLDGVSPLSVLPAYLGAASALIVFGTFASRQQHQRMPIASGG
jgi:hypothetical protein